MEKLSDERLRELAAQLRARRRAGKWTDTVIALPLDGEAADAIDELLALREASQRTAEADAASDRLPLVDSAILAALLHLPLPGATLRHAAMQVRAALDQEGMLALREASQWRPTHRHKKRGTEYVLISFGKMQAEFWEIVSSHPSTPIKKADMAEVAIYRSVDDGALWVRPREEFEDGRFEALPTPPESPK